MQFFDIVRIACSSGAGGDGCVAARREKYIPFGGPAGGNGGRGGDIILVGDAQLTTLAHLHARKHFKAPHGEPGRIKEQYGKDAEDLVIPLPLGTIVRDVSNRQTLCTLEHPGQTYRLLAGGKGGIGNMHFKNATTQYSNFGLLGEPGLAKEIECELQLLADVALLGFPSVGKTSLLNTVSDAAAKTAEYPFTTLIPNLGVVKQAKTPFVMIDIPGLIEGAADGKGLGNEFLRHILKARIWALTLDISRYESGITELLQLCAELQQYLDQQMQHDYPQCRQQIVTVAGHLARQIVDTTDETILWTKYLMIVANKIDLIIDTGIRQELKDAIVSSFSTYDLVDAEKKSIEKAIHLVSAGSQEGIKDWLNACLSLLSHLVEKLVDTPVSSSIDLDSVVLPTKKHTRAQKDLLQIKDITKEKLSRLIENGYLEQKDEKYVYVREISHPDISYLTYVLPRGNDEAEIRYRRTLEKEKLLKQLERAGMKKGDVFLVKSPYANRDDRWIRRE